ncbi:hypothetical protein SDC9_118597 [bioreactor metagenome]|uniref:Uncharacterized protein n=1 Tax=bioreactor metagenome TaxID=1076179 RepID=A0A645C1X0_9ZZZZ
MSSIRYPQHDRKHSSPQYRNKSYLLLPYELIRYRQGAQLAKPSFQPSALVKLLPHRASLLQLLEPLLAYPDREELHPTLSPILGPIQVLTFLPLSLLADLLPLFLPSTSLPQRAYAQQFASPHFPSRSPLIYLLLSLFPAVNFQGFYLFLPIHTYRRAHQKYSLL